MCKTRHPAGHAACCSRLAPAVLKGLGAEQESSVFLEVSVSCSISARRGGPAEGSSLTAAMAAARTDALCNVPLTCRVTSGLAAKLVVLSGGSPQELVRQHTFVYALT
jgi:hypothetical protein